jgi:hypothetical protein
VVTTSRMPHQVVEDRGRAEQHRDPLALDAPEHLVDVEDPLRDHGDAGVDNLAAVTCELFERAGGAQLNSGGYATSVADYQTRWASTLAQYKRTAALGGVFILLPHDLWGADGTTSQSFPGDNGDWTTFDNCLTR